jgi:hypothetical protein
MEGIWEIEWKGVSPKYNITFNKDGTFYQKAGNHKGTWKLSSTERTPSNILTIEYDGGKVMIAGLVDHEFKQFVGHRYWIYDNKCGEIVGTFKEN